ncbi:MAG: hypothetical protein WCC57_14280 [Paracoccaceae bacterium]
MLRLLAIFVVLFFLVCWPHSTFAQQGETGYFPNTVLNDMSGKTVRFDSERHGSGVLYFAQDGRAFLWNPGRIEVQIGLWSGDTMRFLKGSPEILITIEGVMVTFPSGFENRLGIFAYLEANRIHDDLGITEVSEGDVLALEDGEPPCRTCRADMRFSEMLGN